MDTSTLSSEVAADDDAIKAATSPLGMRWRSVEEAGAFLGMSPRVLRETAVAEKLRRQKGARRLDGRSCAAGRGDV